MTASEDNVAGVLARKLARYACSFDAEALPEEVMVCARQRLLDSLACVLGAYDARPVQIARKLAAQAAVDQSSVFGSNTRTTPDLAAFANGVMIRYLDYNDGYMGKEPGHPSDNIPACLAVAESEGAPIREFVAALVIAYEIQLRLQDSASLNERGWDHVAYILPASAAAAARLMRLDEKRATEAINLAINGHIPLRQVRSGRLSDWKGCSAANATRNAVFAAQLARWGMTGPSPIFEGEMGFFKQVSGEFCLDIDAFGCAENGDYAILRSLTKTFPTNGELHTAIWAAIELRKRINHPDSIARIRIDTSPFNRRVLADEEKWRPATRETADHSLPYNVARALLDGDITLDSYSRESIAAPEVHALMVKTSVEEDARLTAMFPRCLANRVTVELVSGEVVSREVITGPGGAGQPMTDEDFERKFRKMAAPHLDSGNQDSVIDFVGALQQQASFAPLFAAMSGSK